MILNLANFLYRSSANGPGIRAALWVQGCPIHCKGCYNEEFWSFEPKMAVEVGALAEQITRIEGIEGVTFSGGEPFSQAEALAQLGQVLIKKDLNIITFTGYPYDHLITGNDPAWKELLDVTDLLIAGPYIAENRCDSALFGSSNQSLIFLTSRFKGHPDLGRAATQKTEFIIGPDGTVITTGFPDNETLTEIWS
ncbi:MAG: 4Fe-4S single cluster domain-containing protein [Methanoregula sp.]|nr:MAG: 4Fe-4S single cluster domain-containing protein [Methanoregula sp.]